MALAVAGCSLPAKISDSDLAQAATPSSWILAVEEPGPYWLGESWFRSHGIDPRGVPEQVQLHLGERPIPHLWLDGPEEAGLLFYAIDAPTRYASWTAYRLTINEGTDRVMETASIRSLTSSPAGQGQETAWATVWQEQDVEYRPQIAAPVPWFWQSIPAPGRFADKVELPGAISGPITVTAQIWIRGSGLDDAAAPRISWDGQQVGNWQPDGPAEQSWTAILSTAVEPRGHELALELPAQADGSPYQVWLDGWGVTYRQQLALQGAGLAWTAEESQATVAGAGGARLLDVTDPLSPLDLGRAQGEGIATQPGNDYWLGHPWLAPSPSHIRALTAVDRASLDQTEYLVIAPESFWPALEPLLQHRQDQGMTVMSLTPNQVYDAFGDQRPDPAAIRSLVQALHGQGRLRYLLLVGDASTRPDGLASEDSSDLIPTTLVSTAYLHETPSDQSLVTDDGGVPLVAIGRFPARSVDEVRSMVDKTIRWEDRGTASTAILTDDQPEFARFVDSALHLPAGPSLRLDAAQEDARDLLLAELDKRALWLNYVGHGSLTLWGDEKVLRREDRWSQAAVVNVWGCLSAYFVHPEEDSLAEVWLRAPRGGAVAFVGPTGGTGVFQQQLLAQVFYDEIEAGRRIGDALLAAWAAGGAAPDAARGYLLLGDPALHLSSP